MTVTDDLRTEPSAVRLQPAYEDPAAVLATIRAGGPFWPIVRYAVSPKERLAVGGDEESATTFVPPWFRRDFALGGEVLVPGADRILHNARFVDAAREVYGETSIVRPTTVYVNVMAPSPAPFVPHTDVPAFRGVTRDDHPLWLLHQMLSSGLFEPWRVRLATAVSWFYEGPGGSFHYWPEGPEGPGAREDSPYDNVAVVADNERTYHGVAPVGSPDAGLITGLTVDSELVRVDGGWEMREAGRAVHRSADDEVRVTVSWKAEVFTDDEERARADDHVDDLTLDRVVEMFLADLDRRGIAVAAPDDPHGDEDWMTTLNTTYGRRPPKVA